MISRLPLRTLIPVLILVGGALAAFGTFALSYQQQKRTLTDRLTQEAVFLSAFIAGEVERNYRHGQPARTRNDLQQASSKRNLILALLLDEDDLVRFATKYSLVGRPLRETPLAPHAAMLARARHSMRAESFADEGTGTLVSAQAVHLAPLPGELIPSRLGVVVAEFDISRPVAQLRAIERSRAFLTVIPLVGLCAIITLVLHWRLTRPLDRLLAKIGTIGEQDSGDIPHAVDVPETEMLDRALNDMARRIEAQTRALRASRDHLDEVVAERTAELTKVNTELQSFSYSVSHDLRAPLRHVNRYVEILLREYGATLDDEGRKVANIIQDAGEKMSLLIDDLLKLSRIGRRPLARENVDMEALVKEVILEISGPDGAYPTIEWVVGSLPPMAVDRRLMRQVWINLLENAAKYSSGQALPRARIDALRKGDQQWYRVADNGVGFDPEYAGKFFDVFHRLHSAREFAGTGVGLAIVKNIIDKHGGAIIGRAAPNEGAVFEFTPGPCRAASLRSSQAE